MPGDGSERFYALPTLFIFSPMATTVRTPQANPRKPVQKPLRRKAVTAVTKLLQSRYIATDTRRYARQIWMSGMRACPGSCARGHYPQETSRRGLIAEVRE